MNPTRRVVRATQRFFEDLDPKLPAERGPNGEPSTNDFQVFELVHIVDRFTVEFDSLPRLIPERNDYRVLVTSGTLVAGLSVIGQLAIGSRTAGERATSPSVRGRWSVWDDGSWTRRLQITRRGR